MFSRSGAACGEFTFLYFTFVDAVLREAEPRCDGVGYFCDASLCVSLSGCVRLGVRRGVRSRCELPSVHPRGRFQPGGVRRVHQELGMSYKAGEGKPSA